MPDQFEFNDSGVCINPEIVEVYSNKDDFLTVKLARRPDGTWDAGYDYWFGGGSGGGGGRGAWLKQKYGGPKGHPDRQSALLHCVRCQIEYLKKYARSNTHILGALQRYEQSLLQPSLFDLMG